MYTKITNRNYWFVKIQRFHQNSDTVITLKQVKVVMWKPLQLLSNSTLTLGWQFPWKVRLTSHKKWIRIQVHSMQTHLQRTSPFSYILLTIRLIIYHYYILYNLQVVLYYATININFFLNCLYICISVGLL